VRREAEGRLRGGKRGGKKAKLPSVEPIKQGVFAEKGRRGGKITKSVLEIDSGPPYFFYYYYYYLPSLKKCIYTTVQNAQTLVYKHMRAI